MIGLITAAGSLVATRGFTISVETGGASVDATDGVAAQAVSPADTIAKTTAAKQTVRGARMPGKFMGGVDA